MSQSLNNKWTKGKIRFDFPQQLRNQLQTDGLRIFPGILDSDIGSEMVLYIVDRTPFVYELGHLEPFRTFLKTGAVKTSYGPVMFMLLAILDPNTGEPVVLFDSQINPCDTGHVAMWRDLARQMYWHFIFVDRDVNQAGFMEVENTFKLDKGLDIVTKACTGMRHTDFAAAQREYATNYSLVELWEKQ